jgi:hypothetical protein
MSRVRSFRDAEMKASGTEIESRMGEFGLNAYESEPVHAYGQLCDATPSRGETDLIRRGESSGERSPGVPCASS